MLPVLEVLKNPPHDFVYAKGVVETAMLRSVKRKVRRSELFDPPESLELTTTDQIPYYAVPHVNVAVYRVFKYFFFL